MLEVMVEVAVMAETHNSQSLHAGFSPINANYCVGNEEGFMKSHSLCVLLWRLLSWCNLKNVDLQA